MLENNFPISILERNSPQIVYIQGIKSFRNWREDFDAFKVNCRVQSIFANIIISLVFKTIKEKIEAFVFIQICYCKNKKYIVI